MFLQKDECKATRVLETMAYDRFCSSERDFRDVRSVRFLRGAECWADHRLVRASLNLVVKRNSSISWCGCMEEAECG